MIINLNIQRNYGVFKKIKIPKFTKRDVENQLIQERLWKKLKNYAKNATTTKMFSR